MKSKKIKRKYIIIMVLLLIFFLVIFLISYYLWITSNTLQKITEEEFKKDVYQKINQEVNKTMLKEEVNNILNVYLNDDNEILYVDYSLNDSYKVLNIITNNLKECFNEDKNNFILKVPLFISSNNTFLSNLGPKITIKVYYINSLFTNIYTKVTNYGLNNALVEAYLKVNVDGQIITPVNDKKIKTSYDFLIASKIINGRVPSIYGNAITSSSSIFDIPIQK